MLIVFDVFQNMLSQCRAGWTVSWMATRGSFRATRRDNCFAAALMVVPVSCAGRSDDSQWAPIGGAGLRSGWGQEWTPALGRPCAAALLARASEVIRTSY